MFKVYNVINIYICTHIYTYIHTYICSEIFTPTRLVNTSIASIIICVCGAWREHLRSTILTTVSYLTQGCLFWSPYCTLDSRSLLILDLKFAPFLIFIRPALSPASEPGFQPLLESLPFSPWHSRHLRGFFFFFLSCSSYQDVSESSEFHTFKFYSKNSDSVGQV